MKKITHLLLVSFLALLLVGCSLGGKKDIATAPSPEVEKETVQPQNPVVDVAQEGEGEGEGEEKEEETQKEEKTTPKEFDPNSFNDEEINELIAMLEGMVEVE